jgi:two-component system, chemotaxis family, sensor kinase CheA
MDAFQAGFFEEARELIVELEAALLELDEKRDDPELVGRAFRALHTIKGSGAMFGFDDLAGFTHHLETAFDRVRNGQLAVTSGLTNLALAASDQIKAMLEQAAGRGMADQACAAEILASVGQLTGAVEASPARPVSQPAQPVGDSTGPVRQWRIRFRPGPEVLVNGTNPLLLLDELRELGDLQVTADPSAIPPLREILPERCYLAWEMTLATAAGRDAIRDVFIFVEDDSELVIEPSASELETTPAAVPARANAPARSNTGQPAASLRVAAAKLDQLVNLVGELVTVQARLSEAAARSSDAGILEIAESVERLTSELRENSMSIRMLPLRATFERFRRLVHDLGAELGKDVELTVEGAETELDKTVIDQLSDPLVHLIRNSMDHGIETPEARRAAGKRSTGRVHLSAQHSGANVLIRVSDDGSGLDVDAVRARGVEKGLIEASARLSEQEIFALIFAPGFSTAREITGVSGRGVGMDVVRRNVEALHGSIELASRPGAGLTVTLRLPLTLAIIDGLLVRVGGTRFVVPLANSLECVELTREDIQAAHGNHIASVRGELIPYIRLSEYFEMDTPRPDREQIMVVETEHGLYGFAVDQVLGDHQTVIKNLGRLCRNVQVVSGATILGDGTVALILDPHRLVHNVIQTASERSGAGSLLGADRRRNADQHSHSKGKQNQCYAK